MVQLDDAQTANFTDALVVARAWAVASGNDPVEVCERVAFVVWTESRGYVYANDGRNTSNSPGVTPAVVAQLRKSLDMPHDKVGSNGRSTGMFQQISTDVGGGWGDMAGTMDPAISTARFLARLVITDNAFYNGTLITPTSTRRVSIELSSPIAADVLRIQQPLADEATSSNYDATQVAIAREIVAQLSPSGTGPGTVLDWIEMADQAALDAYSDAIARKVVDGMINPNVMALQNKSLFAQDTGQGSSFAAQFANIIASIQSLQAKVDALGAALDAK